MIGEACRASTRQKIVETHPSTPLTDLADYLLASRFLACHRFPNGIKTNAIATDIKEILNSYNYVGKCIGYVFISAH